MLCLLINRAFALDVTLNEIRYTLNVNSRTASVAGSSLENVVVPETIEYNDITYSVTTIASGAFSNNKTIKSIKTGNSITCIEDGTKSIMGTKSYYASKYEDGAFHGATNLIEADFGDNLEIIGCGAFYQASNLSKIKLGKSLLSIKSMAFCDCNTLSYIVIPSSTQEIFEKDAFKGCSQLTIINLSSLATTISGQTIYPSSFFSFENSIIDYNGITPKVYYTFNGIGFGFQPTAVNLDALVATVGNHTSNLTFTIANNDMSFDVEIPYEYTINPVTLKAKVSDASRLYGDANPQFTTTYSGFVNNEDASVVTSHGNYTTTATAKSDVGSYSIKQTGATAQNYVFEYEDGTLTVNKAPLTMTANDKTITYGGTIPTFDAKYDGLKNNETQPVWKTAPSLSTTATSASKVGTYPITIGNAEAKNYQLTLNNGTLTIGKAELTVKADNKSRIYGDANPEFTLTYTGLKNGETVPEWEKQPTVETTAGAKSNVGTYPISVKDAVAVNYNITAKDGTLTVNKAALQITPKDATRKYGEENPKFELSYVGLKNNENVPEWTLDPVFTTNATTTSSVGEYAVQVKSAEARNYTLEKKVGTLFITKAPLTVKLLDATRKYGTANPNFEMNYTGLVNGETMPAWTTYPTITTTADEKSDVGDYPITATGGEMKNYTFDGITPGVLSVTPASLVIRAQDASRYYFEENPKLDYICMGFAQGDNVSLFTVKPQLSTTATLQSSVGVYPIEVSGAEIKNYQLTYEKGQLTVDKRTLNVSTKDYTRAYGEENPEFELTYTGFVNNEDESVLVVKPKATTNATANTDVGVYDITIGNGVAENYDFSYSGGQLTIEKAYQTLAWNQDFSDVKQYDQVELLATASSGLDVTYSIEGDQICSIVKIGKKQYLDCMNEGEVVVVAIQEGNKNYWQSTKIYKTIVIQSTSGINFVTGDVEESTKVYDVSGNRINKLQKGLNIIKMSNGTTKKVFVK